MHSPPDLSRIKNLLDYDKEKGVFTWRVTRNGYVVKGQQAGSLYPRGYRRIGVDRVYYLEHRLSICNEKHNFTYRGEA